MFQPVIAALLWKVTEAGFRKQKVWASKEVMAMLKKAVKMLSAFLRTCAEKLSFVQSILAALITCCDQVEAQLD